MIKYFSLLIPVLLPYNLTQAEPVWEEERAELLDMNKAPPNKGLRENKELKAHIDVYNKWKIEREVRLA